MSKAVTHFCSKRNGREGEVRCWGGSEAVGCMCAYRRCDSCTRKGCAEVEVFMGAVEQVWCVDVGLERAGVVLILFPSSFYFHSSPPHLPQGTVCYVCPPSTLLYNFLFMQYLYPISCLLYLASTSAHPKSTASPVCYLFATYSSRDLPCLLLLPSQLALQSFIVLSPYRNLLLTFFTNSVSYSVLPSWCHS